MLNMSKENNMITKRWLGGHGVKGGHAFRGQAPVPSASTALDAPLLLFALAGSSVC
jgi:hypothetical protein